MASAAYCAGRREKGGLRSKQVIGRVSLAAAREDLKWIICLHSVQRECILLLKLCGVGGWWSDFFS